jgi:CDP-glucose 4,6-dehydratase
MNADFWRGKKVFLTGHTGFKGSWLTLWLARLGARVRCYSLPPPTSPSLYERAGVGEGLDCTTGDIRDQAALAAAMVGFAPDIVLHLAAQSVVLSSYQDPIETYSTNVVGTASVLNAVRSLTSRCAVVNVTTDKVYQNQRWVWGYRENDALGGRDPYSSSKACAELVARAFRESYFSAGPSEERRIGIASARAGNVIGGGDWTLHQLIPDTIEALAQGKAVVLRNPGAIRPWQHVLDCLSGYLTLAEALFENPDRYGDEWNFGPSDADMQPVSHVVEVLARPWGINPAWVRDPGVHPHEEMELRLNSQKAIRELRWVCRLPLDTALAWTAEWFQRHGSGQGARGLCEEQIERYMGIGS